MYPSHNQRAIALYSGTLGAYLESSSHLHDGNHDRLQLEQAAEWLVRHNALYRQWYDGIRSITEPNLPVMQPVNLLESRPPLRPKIIMNPEAYDVETGNEDFQTHRRPGTIHRTRQNNTMSNEEPEQEMLLFPCLYP